MHRVIKSGVPQQGGHVSLRVSTLPAAVNVQDIDASFTVQGTHKAWHDVVSDKH